MRKIKLSRFSLKLIFSYLIVILFFVISICTYYYRDTTRLLEKQTITTNQSALQQLSSNISSKLKEFETASYYLMASSSIQNISNKQSPGPESSLSPEADVNEYLTQQEIYGIIKNSIIASENILHVYIYTPTNKVYESGLNSSDPIKLPYDQLLAKNLKATSSFSNGKLYWIYDAESHQLSSFKQLRSLETQEGIGIIELRPKPQFIQDIFNNPDLDPNNNLTLLDSTGQVMFQKKTNQQTNFDALLKTRPETVRIDKSAYHVLYNGIDNVNWSIVMTLSSKEISSSILKATRFIIVLGLAVLMISILVSIIISYGVSLPVRRLRKFMKQVEAGDLSVQISDLGKDEIGDLGRSFNDMVKQVNKSIDEVYVQKLLSKDSELRALQAQINPHFLYNTLESINYMAEIEGVKEISTMVKTLAHLLRSTISDKREYITIREELQYIQSYLYLQNIRFGDKIKVDIQCDEALMNALIPKLVLQPLVENAILHGLEPKISDGRLHLHITRAADNLSIEVADDGIGFEESKASPKGTGIGTNNVDTRIKILYGEPYGVTIHSLPNVGTTAKLLLPIK